MLKIKSTILSFFLLAFVLKAWSQCPYTPTQVSNMSVCGLTSPSVTITSWASGGTNANLVHRWYKNNVLIATMSTTQGYTETMRQSTYQPTLQYGTNTFQVEAYHNGCASARMTFTITASNSPSGNPQFVTPTNFPVNLCYGASIGIVVSGYPEYEWRKAGIVISGVTGSSLTITNTGADIGTVQYQVYGKYPACGTTNGPATFEIFHKQAPAVTVSSGAGDNCEGDNKTFTVSANESDINSTYEWQLDGQVVGSSSTYTTNSSLSSGNHVITCMITGQFGGCSNSVSITSASYNFYIKPRPYKPSTISDVYTTCGYETLPTIYVNSSNPSAATSHKIKINGGAVIGLEVGALGGNSGQSQSAVLLTNYISSTGSYTIEAWAEVDGCKSLSEVFNVTVENPPSMKPQMVTPINFPVTLCHGQSVTIVLAGYPEYEWRDENNTLSGNGNTLTISHNGQYGAKIYEAYGKVPTCGLRTGPLELEIIFNQTPDVSISTVEGDICHGVSKSFEIDSDQTFMNPVYEWKLDDQIVSTASNYTTNTSLSQGVHSVSCTFSALFIECSSSSQFTLPTSAFEILDISDCSNSFKSYTYLQENIIADPDTSLLDQVSTRTEFIDGLGRPNQTNNKGQSPAGKDLVQFFEYDSQGRNVKQYLPYVALTISSDFQVQPISAQENFYSVGYLITHDATPYASTVFEASPLNRPVKSYSPGEAWGPTGNDKFIEQRYLINEHGTGTSATEEKVIAWDINSSGMPVRSSAVSGYIETGGYFSSGQLFVNTTVDEHGNQVREYTNKQGQVILKKVQAHSSGAGNLNNTDYWALTYYLYDDFGNLRYVFPPELSKLIHNGADSNPVATTDLKNWAFRYKYDGRRRMIEKQVPGAGWVYMVHDKRDRLVFTQDSVQRTSNQWLFTKYDALNRAVLTGIHTADTVLSQMEIQARVDEYYDNLSTNGGKWFETYDLNVVNNMHGYDNTSYPIVTSGTTADPNACLTVTYYDNYSFKNLFGSSVFDYKNTELEQSGSLTAQDATAFDRVIGLVTGTKVRMISAATWLKSVNYYDDKYRVIQSITENPKGHEVSTNVYDFVGKVLRTKTSLYTGQPSQWTAVASATIDGELITGTSTANWSAGAVSSQILPAEIDGWAEFTVTKTLNNVAFGLSDQNTNNHLNTIDFNWYMTTPKTARPYMNSSSVGSSIAVQPGDVLRVERVNGKIYWKRNGLIIFPTSYPSTYSSTTQLMADVAFFNNGAAISKVRLSSAFSDFFATAQSITKRFEYDHAGRLINTWNQLNNDDEILLSHNVYNELGQLVDKKLHSTIASATDARQSVDYRYNIRGWITSINNSSLKADNTNDDENDFFGMNLAYNDDLGTGNTANLQYNGNISAIKYSAHLGAVKETGYNFEYDPLNRLKHANHVQNNNTIAPNWTTGDYSENNLTYDLNGNIKTLQRTGKDGDQIDNLVYNYGTVASNKLNYVWDQTADATNKAEGFFDGNVGSSTDYTYDGNGNMLTDKNKNITANITYNHLNLPEKVTRNNSSVTYLYDATGQKRGQIAQYGGGTKFTDYLGAWVLENNEPVFIQHEEGRIVLSETETVFTSDCEDETIATPTANVTVTTDSINGEKYLKVVPAVGEILTKLGVTQLGGTFSVTPGEQYIYRVKGYSNSTRKANLYVAGNGTNMLWAGANLPSAVAGQMTVENRFIIPSNITTISLGVLYNTNSTSVAADFFYINSVELVLVKNTEPEYQYHLKDHLGNVRTTFTTKSEVESATATMETSSENEEAAEFLYYDEAVKINSPLFDHTNGGTTFYSTRLVGGDTTQRYGLAKSLSVMPGDTLKISVYAKYIDPDEESNWTTALQNLISSIQLGTAPPGTIVDGGLAGTTGGEMPLYAAALNTDKENESGEAPMAYLNYLLFDRNWNFIDGGFKRLSTAAKENGSNVEHEKLEIIDTIRQAGYVYIYLSNESEESVEVFFDDLSVEHSKSPVIQTDDYYPFGLTFNSYQRENSTVNNYLYNSKEKQDELDLGWLDYGARMYMPEIGRWGFVDPYTDIYESLSPYSYVENNPTIAVDPDGRLVVYVNGFRQSAYKKWALSVDPLFVSAPHEWHTPNWYKHDSFAYWGEFRKNWNFEVNGESSYFVDGSNHVGSSASGRSAKGEKEGRLLAQKILDGEITLQDGEFIKLVGHSMGAAHAMGIARGLIDSGIDPKIVKVFVFAAHQPNQIKGLEGVEIFQVGRNGDRVSSIGKKAKATNSNHKRIPGSDWVIVPDRDDEEHGGHYIQTFTTEEFKQAAPALFKYLIGAGYINPDGTLIDN